MDIVLNIKKMSTLDKLRALEEIWSDLINNPQDVPVPDWHLKELSAREKGVVSGTTAFVDWKEARKAIRDQTR